MCLSSRMRVCSCREPYEPRHHATLCSPDAFLIHSQEDRGSPPHLQRQSILGGGGFHSRSELPRPLRANDDAE
jgi:hypothetical protein